MRNYFAALRLDRLMSSAHIKTALQSTPADVLADEDDIADILSNETWRSHYRRVHLQYDAIAAVMQNVNNKPETDTHSWQQRVVEFDPVQDTIEIGR